MGFLVVEKREEPTSRRIRLIWLVLMFLLTFIIVAIVIALLGANPLTAYRELFFAPFRNIHTITEIIVTTTPLLFIALGLCFSFKCRFINLGGEGQFFAGGAIATATVLIFKGVEMPSAFFVPLLMVVGFSGGAFLAVIAAFLKNKFGISEIIVTLLSNFVMLFFLSYLLYGPWMDPISVMPQSESFPEWAIIPTLIKGTRSHFATLLFILLVPSVYLILNKTVFGYEIKTVGISLKGAQYGGINVKKIFLLVAIISGGLAGLAGMVEVSGVFHRLRDDISYAYGWNAILVALLGKNHPGWVTLVAFLFSVLLVGGFEMQASIGVPYALSLVTNGLIFFSVLCAEAIASYKIKLGGK